MLKEICLLCFLGINTWTDLRKKEVSLLTTVILAVSSLCWMIYKREFPVDIFFSLGVGILFLAVSILSRGAMGLGDVWIVMALGFALKLEEFLATVLFGVLGSGIWGIVLLLIYRRRDMEIPFVPFLMIGYVGGVLL